MSENKIKVLLAKKKIDVHGRGSKLIARELRDAGMEVVYFRFGTVEDIVNAAIQEDVDVVGVSIMTSGHLIVAEDLIPMLKEQGKSDVMVIMGGVIPAADFEQLEKSGIHKVFAPGLPGETIADYIRSNVETARLN
jgi:methylmalonyl-CoA mutase, C-terminal domain